MESKANLIRNNNINNLLVCMKKLSTYIKNFLKSPRFKAFCWTTLNGFITLVIVNFAEIDWVYSPIVIAALNNLTKYINQTYLSKYVNL